MQLAGLSRRKFVTERGGTHLVYNQETILEYENEGVISKFATGEPKTASAKKSADAKKIDELIAGPSQTLIWEKLSRFNS